MFDQIRTLFRIRKKRKTPPIGQEPKIGAKIIKNGVLITVTQSVSPELWDWLLLSGWRVNSVRHDRRCYTKLPKETIDLLHMAGAARWGAVLGNIMKAAQVTKAR